MKPIRFRYLDPGSTAEAVGLLAEYGDDARILAGGQSLVPLMNFRLAHTPYLVDINPIRELDGIERDGDVLKIGALVRYRDAENSDEVRSCCPLVQSAIPHIGHPAIRNRGTLCGSLAQADPTAEMPAVMMALNASVVATSTGGAREIQVMDLFDGPLTTTLQADELITEIRVPCQPRGASHAVVELSRRHGDFALAGIAVSLVAGDQGRMSDVRVAGFGVGPEPMRLSRTEAHLEGEKAEEAVFEAAGFVAREEIPGSDDIHASTTYRKHVIAILVARALRRAIGTGAERG